MNRMLIVEENTIQLTINTLKNIDARGFESMDMLVGLVRLFNGILANAPRIEPKPADTPAKEQKSETGEEAKGEVE